MNNQTANGPNVPPSLPGHIAPPPLPDWGQQAAGRALHCFVHPDREGSAVCRVCHRTLCRECITEVSGPCCCKTGCAESFKGPRQMRAKSLADFQKIGESLVGSAFRPVRGATVVLLVATGIAVQSSPADASGVGSFLIAIGVIYMGAYYFFEWNWKKLLKRVCPPNSASDF